MKSKLSDEAIKNIIDSYNKGKGSDSIAKDLNMHPNSILKILKKNNVHIRKAISRFQEQDIEDMQELYKSNKSIIEISEKYLVSPNVIRKIFLKLGIINHKSVSAYFDYFDYIIINGNKLSRKYLKSSSIEEREKLSHLILEYIRSRSFKFIENNEELQSSLNSVFKSNLKIENNKINSYNLVGVNLCKFFCQDFYKATTGNKPSLLEAFNDDVSIMKVINHNLGLTESNTISSITIPLLLRGLSTASICGNISVFRPSVAKALYEEFTEAGDTIFDFSAGWGGRMLGAVSLGRKYIGIDPMTIPSLERMKKYFKFDNVELINGCSEDRYLEENSIDFAFSSPPYNDLEFYSKNKSQAYNKGEKYFYEVYWKNTLLNIKDYLKPGKYLAINMVNLPRMLIQAINIFGQPVREISMEMSTSNAVRNHEGPTKKIEPIYIFKNNK